MGQMIQPTVSKQKYHDRSKNKLSLFWRKKNKKHRYQFMQGSNFGHSTRARTSLNVAVVMLQRWFITYSEDSLLTLSQLYWC